MVSDLFKGHFIGSIHLAVVLNELLVRGNCEEIDKKWKEVYGDENGTQSIRVIFWGVAHKEGRKESSHGLCVSINWASLSCKVLEGGKGFCVEVGPQESGAKKV